MSRAITRLLAICAAGLALTGAAPKEWRVIDETGRELRFGSQIIRGQVTVVHFMFTTCESFCPLSGAVLSQTRDRLARQEPTLAYRFVSISIKPAGTTPSKLKQWLRKHGGGAKWTALHVEQPALGEIMRFYGESERDIVLHSSQMLVLNPRGAISRRFDRMPTPQLLAGAMSRAGRL